MFTAAKSGVGASRVFHHDARLPWGSVSMTATGPAFLCSASTARCAVSVVLPLPPFCDAIALQRHLSALPKFAPVTWRFCRASDQGHGCLKCPQLVVLQSMFM